MRNVVLFLVGSSLVGCAGWQAIEAPGDTALAPRQQVQVWRRGEPRILHAVRFTSDSLSGVPFHKPPTCDSCRIAVARSDVDSVRVGNLEGPGIFWGMLPFALLIYLLISLRGPQTT